MKDTSIEENRIGYAGMHDIITIENYNRTLKKQEKVEEINNIYMSKPEDFDATKYKMKLLQGPHDEREGFALFPLGLGYIARIVHEMGIDVSVIDAHAEKLNINETIAKTLNQEYNVLGITALSTQYDFVKKITKRIKEVKKEVIIILGGQLAHYNSHTVIENTGVDICVIGEGEITIQEIFYNFNSLGKVKGIAFRGEGGEYIKNESQKRIKNLDIVPLPYYDIFNMEYYMSNGFYGARVKKAINVLSSRGCPYSCTFCSLSFPNVTYRSVDNVIEEIKYLQKRFGIDGLSFCDELFVINKKRVLEFCEKIKPLNIRWGGQARANIVNDDVDFLLKMKDAGAVYIGYGLESATSDMLSSMQKKTTVEQNIKCMEAAQEAGMVVVAQYMFGFPGETLESIAAGIDYFDKVKYVPPIGPDSPAHISITIPLPGSQLYEDCKKNGLIINEDKYLEKISIGYMESKNIIVNLTKFTDEELLQLKQYAEQKMMENYVNNMYNMDKYWRIKNIIRKVKEIYFYEGGVSLLIKLLNRILMIAKIYAQRKININDIMQLVRNKNNKKQDYIYRSEVTRDMDKILAKFK